LIMSMVPLAMADNSNTICHHAPRVNGSCRPT
jgi:hypothetical protein